MKRIRRLSKARDDLKGLKDYRKNHGERANWDHFRNRGRRNAYKKLVSELYRIQHGLCGYCEIDIILRGDQKDRQIEHVIPRNHPTQGKANELDPANMILCCLGGTYRTNNRWLDPISENCSCGQAKGDSLDPQFIDPRDLPSLPSLVIVNYETGEIIPDTVACAKAGIDVNSLKATIQATLKLNVPRLKEARKQHWDDLKENWDQYVEDPHMLEEAARTQLLPGEDGCLQPFFSTSRSYFGQVAEKILAETPQKWI